MKHWMLRLYAPLFLLGFVATAVVWIGHCHGDPLWLLALLAAAIAVSFQSPAATDKRWRTHGVQLGKLFESDLVNSGNL